MLDTLEESPEDPALILKAKKYLRGVLKSMGQTARSKASSATQAESRIFTSPSVSGVSRAPTDLTGASTESKD